MFYRGSEIWRLVERGAFCSSMSIFCLSSHRIHSISSMSLLSLLKQIIFQNNCLPYRIRAITCKRVDNPSLPFVLESTHSNIPSVDNIVASCPFRFSMLLEHCILATIYTMNVLIYAFCYDNVDSNKAHHREGVWGLKGKMTLLKIAGEEFPSESAIEGYMILS